MPYVKIANIKGEPGAKGDTGTLAFLDATAVAADQPAAARMVTDLRGTGAEIDVPRGLPGLNAVPTDEAVGVMVAAQGSATNAAVRAQFFDLSPHVNVRAHGAVGDGAADDGPAIQAAIDAAATFGAATLLPAGRYKINQTLQMRSNTTLRGDGAVSLDYRGVPKVGAARYAIRATGTLGTPRLLTANAVKGTSTLEVDTAGIENGGWVLVATNGSNYYPYGGSTLVDRGEIKQARSALSAQITFDQAMYDNYTLADGATVTPINFVENIAIEGIHFIGSNTAGEGERAIQLDYVNGFRINGNVIEGTDIYCVQLNSSIRGEVSGNRMTGVHYDGVTGSVFYAVSVMNACQWVRVADNHAERVRHMFVTSAMGAGQGQWGMPRFITCVGNVAQNMQATAAGRSFAYEHHGFGDAILIVGNVADGCYSGFCARGPGVTFEANIVRNWYQHAFQVHADTVDARNIIIRNNQASDRMIDGGGANDPNAIRIDLGKATVVRNVIIAGNAIEVDKINIAGGLYATGSIEGGLSIEDNTFTWVGASTATGWIMRSSVPGTAMNRNRIAGNVQSGIYAGAARQEVRDNTIVSTVQQPAGDAILATGADCIVAGNVARRTYMAVRGSGAAPRLIMHSNIGESTIDPFAALSDRNAKANVWTGGATAINN